MHRDAKTQRIAEGSRVWLGSRKAIGRTTRMSSMLTQRRKGAISSLILSAPLSLCVRLFCLLSLIGLLLPAISRGEVTAEQVNVAIKNGVAYLEKMQSPDGRWAEYPMGGTGGTTALCTLALLNSGRTPADESVRKALAELEKIGDPEATYSASLIIMAFA